MAAAFALAIVRGNNIFICISETTAVVSEILFHGKGRDGKRHLSTQFIAQATFKSAKHKKSFSVATWIFCMEPFCFGIIKGEQPLVCNGDDRGQWPKQGGAVGAAACRMRVPSKARSRRREPQPAASRASKVAGAFLVLFLCVQKSTYPAEKNFIKAIEPFPRENAPYGKSHSQCLCNFRLFTRG